MGSTVVKELRGTESTKKSIQKLKKTVRDPRVSLGITLAISYRGVRFLNAVTNVRPLIQSDLRKLQFFYCDSNYVLFSVKCSQEPICEHEIRNIHCACQDADDLTHFAYITKDHASRTHFCHVFCVPTMVNSLFCYLILVVFSSSRYRRARRETIIRLCYLNEI